MIGDGFLDSEGFAVSAGCIRFRFVTWTRPPFVGPDIQMNFIKVHGRMIWNMYVKHIRVPSLMSMCNKWWWFVEKRN